MNSQAMRPLQVSVQNTVNKLTSKKIKLDDWFRDAICISYGDVGTEYFCLPHHGDSYLTQEIVISLAASKSFNEYYSPCFTNDWKTRFKAIRHLNLRGSAPQKLQTKQVALLPDFWAFSNMCGRCCNDTTRHLTC